MGIDAFIGLLFHKCKERLLKGRLPSIGLERRDGSFAFDHSVVDHSRMIAKSFGLAHDVRAENNRFAMITSFLNELEHRLTRDNI